MRDVQHRPIATDEVRTLVRACREEHGATIDAFHRLWYEQRFTWPFTFFEGVPLMKNPMDLWIFQEIIWDLKPDLVVETGTAHGGAALFYVRQLDRIGRGAVVSIDVEPADELPEHPRLHVVRGSSVDPEVVAWVHAFARGRRTMVVLDSDHAASHVRAELDAYAGVVSPGLFLVVEDTNINGRPIARDWKGGAGPGVAVDAWLDEHPEFAAEPLAERYLLTTNPGGWLRRVA